MKRKFAAAMSGLISIGLRVQMHYFKPDVGHLIGLGPYLPLAGKGGLLMLRRMAINGRLYASALADYPSTKCEPLETHYACLLSLGALDSHLFRDLMTEMSWRGVVWGAWLASLRPHEEFASLLKAVHPVAHENNKVIIDIALAIINGEQPAHIHEHIECIAEIRMQLSPLILPKVPLRLQPIEEPESKLFLQKAALRQMYKSNGADAAIEYLRPTLLHEYLMTYPEWRRSKLAQ